MTTKEKIVEIAKSQGYDTVTACEIAQDCIREFKEEARTGKRIYNIGKVSFALEIVK